VRAHASASLPGSARRVVTALCDQVRADRLVRRTIDLVSVPSPPGQEGAVAEEYARCLVQVGLDVEFDRQYPESPSVVARSREASDGPVLQLAGHLDTISSPHQPPYVVDGTVVGRGACDRKGGLAVMAEVAQVITESDLKLGGSLLLTAHGQHEEAVGGRQLHAPLLGLLERGVHGSACIIPEGPHEGLPLAGRGLVIFRILFRRDGEPVHEILSDSNPPPNPIMACQRFVRYLEQASQSWTGNHQLAGPESFFIGSIQGGDYYNRIPASASVWGTRRYPPGTVFSAVHEELTQYAQRAACEIGCEAEIDIQKSGQPFSVSESEPLVEAVRDSYRLQTGRELPLIGMKFAADSSQFINVAGIPAVYHGTDSATAHSDLESVTAADLVRCAKVILGSVVGYLGLAELRTANLKGDRVCQVSPLHSRAVTTVRTRRAARSGTPRKPSSSSSTVLSFC